MKESYWIVFVVMLGVITVLLINLFQTLTNTDEHNYNLLKETTESAMVDAFDLATYTSTGNIRIDREKFVENFIRRFAEDASLAQKYTIEIYDVHEYPPKVSIQIKTKHTAAALNNEIIDFNIWNRLDAILEIPY
ncbi:MAG TPA: hypothetical protein IAB58_00200 [Candidatus Pelethosoma merdigallinarum]|nr:hypothetical protein [Candidatus Pelethosoma merdigallinarum]